MQRDAYDKALRSGCVKIENVFAFLKYKWQVLKNLNFITLHYGQVILACCVLHHFCKLHENGLTDYPPLPRKDFNGLDHPRQLENENQSKLQQR